MGKDYCVMPIAYQYGQDYYIEQIICDNSNPEIVETRLIMALLQHKVQMSRFESNSAGGRVVKKVQELVKSKSGITKITTKYTTTNKETRIIVDSPFIMVASAAVLAGILSLLTSVAGLPEVE